MTEIRLTSHFSTHGEVNLTAAHYVIQKRVLLHYLKISGENLKGLDI